MTDGQETGNEHEHLHQLLGELVRNGMDRRGWSQYRLAQVTGVSEKHISQLLNGKTVGSLKVWDRLLKAVGSRDGEEEDQ